MAIGCKPLALTGVEIPELGIGTWNYHAGPEPLRAGLDAGALFFDTAESYGSEPDVGRALAGRRGQVFLATKVSPENFHPRDFVRSAEASLRRLGTDRVDLLQLHEYNPGIPLEDTLGALESLIEQGKVRFAGVSNFALPQLERACRAMRKHPIAANQVRYNITDRTIEAGLLQHCQRESITIIAYSPLARGLDRLMDCDPDGVLPELARETGKSIPQIVLNWLLAKPGVVAIPKGNSAEHVLENCGASGWRLTESQLLRLGRQVQSRRRGRLEEFVKRNFPRPLQQWAKQAVGHLPRGLRRKVR